VRRTQHVSVRLAVQVVAVLETAVAAQEALILETPHRLPDAKLAHYSTRFAWWQENPYSAEFLQLRDTGTGAILVLLSGAAADAS
jgi:alpha-D-ribose 1-methylphosphonate 5-phosphate C-P lyase